MPTEAALVAVGALAASVFSQGSGCPRGCAYSSEACDGAGPGHAGARLEGRAAGEPAVQARSGPAVRGGDPGCQGVLLRLQGPPRACVWRW